MYISIHAPAKGATGHACKTCIAGAISIHAPAKGATGQAGNVCRRIQISIHAPAKGATSRWQLKRGRTKYFNPRSREGSDKRCWSLSTGSADFNPRSREGSDADLDIAYDDPAISIHAPAKGATRQQLRWIIFSGFQSTLPRRERLRQGWALLGHMDFNPRSREGSDEKNLVRNWMAIDFNPRSREGSDSIY